MVSDRSVYVRVKGDVSDFNRAMMAGSASAKAFTNELNTSTDRTTMLTQSLLAIGPALVPLTAAAVPAVSALTNQLAFAAAGAGVAVLAFQGVGDALKATNDYAIEPTEANLEKMRQSLSELGPAGREFVAFLQEIRPEMQGLQDAAQAGLFPGMQSGIEDMMTRLPQFERIVTKIATGMGDLIAEAGENLASPRWSEFFDFLENEAHPALMDFGRTLGNFGEGFANLWMAFDPVSDQFSKSFLEMSRDFADWTDGLSETQGFQEFLDYVSRVGPKAWDTLGALGNALLQIVEAAAPVGEAALPAIEAIADTIAVIADSDLGPAAVGIVALTSAYSRLIAVRESANSSALSNLFGKSSYGGTVANIKGVSTATTELKVAQDRLATSAISARDAQFAMIPTADKRKALTSYMGEYRAVAEAEKQLATATQARRAAMAKGAVGAAGLAFVMSDLDNKMGLSNTAMLGMAGSLAGPWGAAVGGGIGLAMDFAAANDDVWASIDQANKIVKDGTAPLEEQFAALEQAAEKMGEINESGAKNQIEDLFGKSDVDEARDAWSQAADQYDENVQAAQNVRLAEAGLSEALRGTSDATREQVDAVLALIQTRNDLANETLSALDAELNYEAAIDAATEAAAKGKDGLDSNTEAGRENLGLLGDLAGAWNDLSPAQQNAEGASDRARESFIAAAEGMGASKKRARELADELLEIPTNVSTDYTLNGAEPATVAARNLRAALLNIPGLTTTTIRTIEETFVVPKKTQPKQSLKDMLTPYTGMRLPAGYWGGGKVPGVAPLDPTEDNVWAMGAATRQPLMVRSGEWIINEPQSEKNDPWLRAINNGLVLDDIFSRAAIPGFASGGRYEDYQALTKSSKLDLKRQEQQIRQIEESLTEKETVGKGKDKHKRLKLRGLDRTVAELELKDAKAELAKMKRENADLAKNYGTSGQEERREEKRKADEDAAEKAEDERKDAEDAAVKAAEAIVKEAADRFTSAKTSAADRFTIGSATSAAAVDRNLKRLLVDASTFLGLLGDLKSKGASPWLLGELVKAGPTPGAIRLAREYNTNQAALDSVNVTASGIDQYTTAYAGLVGNANFMAPAAWNSGVSSASQAPITASIVGAEISVGADGLMTFVNGQIVISQDAQTMEVRTS